MGRLVGGATSPESQAAMNLRMLAGASYLDIMEIHGVSRTTTYETFHRVVDAVNNHPTIGRFPWPTTEEDRMKVARKFKQHSHHRLFANCVGAVDGLLISILCPSHSQAAAPIRFHSGNKNEIGLN